METVHASAVAVDGHGVLIRGASGAGKSTLAWGMMSYGAALIADDQTVLDRKDGAVWLSAPAAIRGMIEARGIGLLRAEPVEAPLSMIVDLDVIEQQRLPSRHQGEVFGQYFPLVHKNFTPLFPYILVHYLRHGRQE